MNGVNGEDTVFVRCLSVCASVRSGPVKQTSLKRLKLRTSNLICMFPGTVRTWPLKNCLKGAWPGSRDLVNFWALNANGIAPKRLKLRTSNLKVVVWRSRLLQGQMWKIGTYVSWTALRILRILTKSYTKYSIRRLDELFTFWKSWVKVKVATRSNIWVTIAASGGIHIDTRASKYPCLRGEGIVSLGVGLSRCHAVCVSAALVSTAKVMRCIQRSLVFH